MQNSIGIVEVTGSANAIYVVDKLLKAAGVRFVSWETVFGIGRGFRLWCRTYCCGNDC